MMGALLLFVRLWFSYTIVQWYWELKEDEVLEREVDEYAHEVVRGVERRRREFAQVEEYLSRNAPVVGQVVSNQDAMMGVPANPAAFTVGEPVVGDIQSYPQLPD